MRYTTSYREPLSVIMNKPMRVRHRSATCCSTGVLPTPDSRIVTCVLNLSDSCPIRQAIGPARFRAGGKGRTVLCCKPPGLSEDMGARLQVTSSLLLPCPPPQPPHGTADDDAVSLWSTQTKTQTWSPDPQLLRIPTLSFHLCRITVANRNLQYLSFLLYTWASATRACIHIHTHTRSCNTCAKGTSSSLY